MTSSYVDVIYLTLEYMGYGYLRRGDYQNAYGAYEAAAEKFLGTIYPGSEKKCKENMIRIERKQRNPDEAVGFYFPLVNIDETLFYPPSTSTSRFKLTAG